LRASGRYATDNAARGETLNVRLCLPERGDNVASDKSRQPRPAVNAASFARPTAFFHNGRGDHILTLPTIRALAAIFAGRLTLVCGSGAHARYFSDIPFRAVIETQFHSANEAFQFDVQEVAGAISRCDLFLSLARWHSDSVRRLVCSVAPSLSLGFSPGVGTIVPPGRHAVHAMERTFEIARYFRPAITLDEYTAPPAFSQDARARAAGILNSTRGGRRVLCIHNETDPRKMWPSDRLKAFIDGFLIRHPDFIVVIVSKLVQRIDVDPAMRNRVVACFGLPLDVAFCLVAQADLFVGVDSCMLHVADSCRVPGVGLFGPTPCDGYGFRLTLHRHVCGYGAMMGVRVSEALQATDEVIALMSSGTGARGPIN
jgi:hypothetical protein